MKKSWLLIVAMILAISAIALAGDAIKAPFVKRGPEIDGVLDDDAWATAAEKGGKISLDYHLNARRIPDSTPKTEIYVAWDYDFLYIAFKCYQDEADVIASKNVDGYTDVWVDEDDVEFFIDTQFPASGYTQFVSSPLGIRSVTVGDWDVAAEIYKDHWVVEMAFPYDVFGMWPDAGDEWAINFARHLGYMSGAGDDEWLTYSPLVSTTFLDAFTLSALEFVK